MKPFEMEPTWLTFPGGAIVYPHVYNASTQFNTFHKYSISADAARLHGAYSDDTRTFIRLHTSAKGFITAKTVGRPEIECSTLPRLVAKLQEMDAQNINRDHLFADCALVSFGVSPYRYELPPVARSIKAENEMFGYALYLHKVRISLPHEI